MNPDPKENEDESTSGEGEASEGDREPVLVDESQFEDDGDDDDDDMPDHFGAVAHADEAGASTAEGPSSGEGTETLPVPAENSEIPLDLIDKDALWVVKRLHAKGYEAYLTGGCVRDLLLGRTPKDFDVATAAHPNQVRNVFRNCRLVGRRFRLAHVFFPSGKVIETATFRANPIDELEDLPTDLLVDRDNVFGNVEQDAKRRDLTVNGLFYDPIKGKVIDYVEGRKDLDAKMIRTIGVPDVRFQEDPVRILRAIKFATRLGFEIEDATYAAMRAQVGGLVRCAPARLQEELLRLLTSGHAKASLALCEEIGVLEAILPEIGSARDMPLDARPVEILVPPAPVEAVPEGESTGEAAAEAPETAATHGPPPGAIAPHIPTSEERHARMKALLQSLDDVRTRDADITSALALAVLLTPAWEAMRDSTSDFMRWFEESAQKWNDRIRLTRHDRERIPQILAAQDDLAPGRRGGHHARSVVHRPSFKEALMLYTLRLHAAGQPLDEIGLWKAIARAHNAQYKQPRMSERNNRQRHAAAQGGGDRGGRFGGGGGGGGGGGRGGRRRRRR